jgi:hypothetical protein
MFIGHFAVGFGAKAISPKLSLGTLFLAAQFLDLLWPTLLMLGVERVSIVPGATLVTPLVFEHYPYSHSLLFVIGWGILIAGIYFLFKRKRSAAILLGVLVVSHWLLDLIVHQPDLPLFPGSTTMLGLNAWSSLIITLLIEGALFVCGVWLYYRTTEAIDAKGRWGLILLLAFLLTIYAGNLFGEPPPGPEAIAWVGQLQWLLVVWGYWLDTHRRTDI